MWFFFLYLSCFTHSSLLLNTELSTPEFIFRLLLHAPTWPASFTGYEPGFCIEFGYPLYTSLFTSLSASRTVLEESVNTLQHLRLSQSVRVPTVTERKRLVVALCLAHFSLPFTSHLRADRFPWATGPKYANSSLFRHYTFPLSRQSSQSLDLSSDSGCASESACKKPLVFWLLSESNYAFLMFSQAYSL